jgi:membrane-associated phospholipid phosphatase
LFRLDLVAADGCVCKQASVNGLDRWVAGTYRPGVSLAGDILISSVISLAVLLDLLNVVEAAEPATSFLTDLVVMGEALLVNGAINQVVKFAAARPRPLLYERALSDPLQNDPDNYVSFYSSHTSTAFALALAYAQTFAYRNPDSPYRLLVYAAAVVAGSGIGATRIAAGKHFPSDVLVGAAVGAAIGLFIPWLHRLSARAQLSVTLAPGSVGLALVVPEL